MIYHGIFVAHAHLLAGAIHPPIVLGNCSPIASFSQDLARVSRDILLGNLGRRGGEPASDDRSLRQHDKPVSQYDRSLRSCVESRPKSIADCQFRIARDLALTSLTSSYSLIGRSMDIILYASPFKSCLK